MRVQFLIEERETLLTPESAKVVETVAGAFYPTAYDDFGEPIDEEYFGGYKILETVVQSIDCVKIKYTGENGFFIDYIGENAEIFKDKDGTYFFISSWSPCEVAK